MLPATRETLVINENISQAMEEYGSYIMPVPIAEIGGFIAVDCGDQVVGWWV